MNLDALYAQLIRHEGLRLRPYRDTVGKLTIGVGRNLDDVGISEEEARYLLRTDVLLAIDDLHAFPWFVALDETRQLAVVDLRFNLGPSRFRKFKRFLAAMAESHYEDAADHLVHSLWYVQVGQRAKTIVRMIRDA